MPITGRITGGIPLFIHISRYRVLIGKPKIWYMTIWLAVSMGLRVICVMGGRSSRIILCSIKRISVRIKIVGRGHVRITTLKNKKELLILLWPPNALSLCPKIALSKGFSKTQFSKLASSLSLSSRKSVPWFTKSKKRMVRSQFQKQSFLLHRNFQVKKNLNSTLKWSGSPIRTK